MIVFVGAGGHVATVLQRGIGDDAQDRVDLRFFAPTPPRLPALAPSSSRISSGCAGAHGRRAQAVSEFGFVKLMIAAQQDQHRTRFTIDRRDENERLDLP